MYLVEQRRDGILTQDPLMCLKIQVNTVSGMYLVEQRGDGILTQDLKHLFGTQLLSVRRSYLFHGLLIYSLFLNKQF
jgi:hypothetical protein